MSAARLDRLDQVYVFEVTKEGRIVLIAAFRVHQVRMAQRVGLDLPVSLAVLGRRVQL